MSSAWQGPGQVGHQLGLCEGGGGGSKGSKFVTYFRATYTDVVDVSGKRFSFPMGLHCLTIGLHYLASDVWDSRMSADRLSKDLRASGHVLPHPAGHSSFEFCDVRGAISVPDPTLIWRLRR